MKKIWKNLPTFVPVLVSGIVVTGTAASLGSYIAPVFNAADYRIASLEAETLAQGTFDLEDGTYQGSAQGYGGMITVAVTIEDHSITAIELLSSSDDAAFLNRAKGVIDQIMTNQSVSVDTVSGATYSSRGIINAVKNALGITVTDENPQQTTQTAPTVKKVSEDFAYADGTYTGNGTGFSGEITVEVTIAKGKIKSIEVTKSSDGSSYMQNASAVIKRIIKAQSTNVDTVSGATFSSSGIIEAVRDALDKAKVTDTKETETTASETTAIEAGLFSYPDGIYTGIGEGYGGDIEATVVLQNQSIKAILITKHDYEDPTFFQKASTVADQIVAYQSTSVDTVSGATYSSSGIIEAVTAALEKAKNGDTSADQETTEKAPSAVGSGSGDAVYYGVVVCNPNEEESFDPYNLHVKLVLKDGVISEITDIYGDGDSGNDRYIQKAANGTTRYPGVAAQLVSNNGTDDISAVSGATCSSRAIVNAVNVLIEAAKKDGNYVTETPSTPGSGSGGSNTPGSSDGSKPSETVPDETQGQESEQPGETMTEQPGDGSGETMTEQPGDGSGETMTETPGNEDGSNEGGTEVPIEPETPLQTEPETVPQTEPETPQQTEAETTPRQYRDGSYTAAVTCEPGEYDDFDPYNLTLTVVIADDKITEIKNVTGDGGSDNDWYINRAKNGTSKKTGVIQQIINKNGTDGVDTISSATCSSRAIIKACSVALEQAKNN